MRNSGILFPIFSLPTEYGIGTLGREAREFVDFLQKAGQRYWQVLPVGPVGFGNSPYQSFSAFAGNPYYIDLQMLHEEGLLTKADFSKVDWGRSREQVDYEKLYLNRTSVLYHAYERGWDRDWEIFSRFRAQQRDWLEDYALFMALKERFDMAPWQEWPEEVRTYRQENLRPWREELRDRVQFWAYLQFLFFDQWGDLKRYANAHGVEFIGDMPIYVAMDSADAWSHPEMFQLDEYRRPTAVSGVGPDAFSAEGQKWGNPLYDWSYLRYTGYKWWVDRLRFALGQFDRVRIDHFRGFESYYAIPVDAPDARQGEWRKGPGMDLFGVIQRELGQTRLLAEDLGIITWEVEELLRQTGYPGMKVLQFAFDASGTSNHLPHTYPHNLVAYTGTHDNNTTRGWLRDLSKEDLKFCCDYLNVHLPREVGWAMIHAVWQSVADTAIAPIQDFLELGEEARINTPATDEGNWQWRLKKGALGDRLANRIQRLTQVTGRLSR